MEIKKLSDNEVYGLLKQSDYAFTPPYQVRWT